MLILAIHVLMISYTMKEDALILVQTERLQLIRVASNATPMDARHVVLRT